MRVGAPLGHHDLSDTLLGVEVDIVRRGSFGGYHRKGTIGTIIEVDPEHDILGVDHGDDTPHGAYRLADYDIRRNVPDTPHKLEDANAVTVEIALTMTAFNGDGETPLEVTLRDTVYPNPLERLGIATFLPITVLANRAAQMMNPVTQSLAWGETLPDDPALGGSEHPTTERSTS